MQKGNHLDVKTTITEVDELISKLKLAKSLADELAKALKDIAPQVNTDDVIHQIGESFSQVFPEKDNNSISIFPGITFQTNPVSEEDFKNHYEEYRRRCIGKANNDVRS